MSLRLYDRLLRIRGLPASGAHPCASIMLADTPRARVGVRIYLFPAPSSAWFALATVSVDFRDDLVSIEMEYDCGVFAARPDPAALLTACVAGITRIWGGPEHFIRFGLLELSAPVSPMTQRN